MKNLFLLSMIMGAFVCMAPILNRSYAQELTVPDYAYGTVYSEWGTVDGQGVTNPGPYAGYSEGDEERPADVFLAHGYRWWGYPENILLICHKFQPFNYPGYHGVWDMSHLGCSGAMLGHSAAWGGVVVEPELRSISCLGGTQNDDDGPTEQWCIWLGMNKICYPIPSHWGYTRPYGYLRKIVEVKSTGSLQVGDPVDITASLASQGVFEGDGSMSAVGTLFLNKIDEMPWHNEWGMGREYLRAGDVADITGTPEMMNNMLGHITYMSLNNTENTSAIVAIGDIIVVEVVFDNKVVLENPGERYAGEKSEGWVGERPDELFSYIEYTRTDSIKKMIKNYGNTLIYNLTSDTPGAFLEALSPAGPNLDTDQDGISDTREKGPDGSDDNYDGNTDGLADHEQANVASFHTYDGLNYVTMVVPEDVELTQLVVASNPSPDDMPADADFPFGFFDFSIDGLDPGEAITVMLYLHGGETVDKYYKYGYTPDNNEKHWYEFMYDGETGADINTDVITLYFVDGLRGDEDITVNGSIKEPGGPMKDTSTGINEESISGFVLGQNYPNPFAGQTKIGYEIFNSSQLIIRVFNLAGQEVKTLVNQQMPAGKHEVVWDGRDNRGNQLRNGLYFYRMEVFTETGSHKKIRKMVLKK
ncbi:choice-of-anchor U domain-containing protein [Saccharicrinis sp. GN24d3]|uniref:choice-of-anchor U domain-containing protein n=1 Tax=Saccharicrinis sp. GN24d3 TaxID=3458416 RepID=UPI00403588BA